MDISDLFKPRSPPLEVMKPAINISSGPDAEKEKVLNQ
eukprot:CAMPEP_0202967384 /NCGR_PEP_ID=MMETSP1396-20130829/12220_1 /ASSEMBLY_ACC=CAM_ASM_000872 /TAXON_ID= /ORGANISM="Pseudokeronopsis sp., Strain Brazil" /LENGTH=37 /DNA_ID= /DNA_START= /DNA_END= /DNA_ORIENTATION=